TGKTGIRALGDFELLDGETLAGGHAGVTQAIDKNVAAGLLATDDVTVAEGIAVFAGAQGNARLRAEDLTQIGLAGVIDCGLGNDRNVLRCFSEWTTVAFVTGCPR